MSKGIILLDRINKEPMKIFNNVTYFRLKGKNKIIHK